MTDGISLSEILLPLGSGDLIELVMIVLLAVVLTTLVQHVFSWLANRLASRARLMMLSSVPVIRLVIVVWAVTLIVPRLVEPSLQNMAVLLGTIGLAIGFALKDYVSSLIAGVVAVGEQNYRNGDWVRIGDVYGEVRKVGLRTLEIVTPDNDRVLMPHQQLWTQPVHNANNGEARLQCVADFYLHPAHDGHAVCRVLEDVALTSPYLYFEEPIAVIAHEKPWGTHYRIRAFPLDSAQQFRFVTDLTVRGRAALQALDVQFTVMPAVFSEREYRHNLL